MQPPFMMMPWMQPWQQTQPEAEPQPPVRVAVALVFLRQLSTKSGGHGVPGEPPLEIEGQELLPVEEQALAAACNMLTAYFKGELNPSAWEAADIDVGTEELYKLVDCPNCGGQAFVGGEATAKISCPCCHGKGKVFQRA